MKRMFFILFIVLNCCITALAQNKQACPNLEVISHAVNNNEYEPLLFLLVSNEKTQTLPLKYEWKTSSGKIIEGQDTSSIKVSAINLTERTPITATVKVQGLPEGCSSEFFGTNYVAVGITVERVLFRLYGKVSMKEELAGLDQIFYALSSSEKDYRGLIWINIDESKNISATRKHIQKLLRLAERRGRKFDWGNLIFYIEKSDRDSISGIILSPGEIWKCENCEIIKGSDIKLKKSN